MSIGGAGLPVARCRPMKTLVRLEIVGDDRVDTGWLKLARRRLRNHYADGTASREYLADAAYRPGIDAVAVLPWRRRAHDHSAAPAGVVIEVLLRQNLRPGVELRAQLGGVEDLAVERDHERAVPARHRLVAAGEVEDREPAAGEADRELRVVEDAALVGAAVVQRPGELLEEGRLVRPGDRCEPAHRPRA